MEDTMDPKTYANHDDPNYNSKTAAGCEEAGEPCFTLRAQDIHAAATVREWASRVRRSQGPQSDIAANAERIATEMDTWPVKKEPDL
jgi:hypothetical protein